MVRNHTIKSNIVIALALLLLSIFFGFVFKYALLSEDKIFQKILTDKIQRYETLFSNLNARIIDDEYLHTREQLKNFFSQRENRDKYIKILSLVEDQTTKYIYILQRDSKKRYRFLLDASKEDKASFYQKFDITNKKYSKLYSTKKPQIIFQKKIAGLYVTYLYPILYNDNILGVFSVDIDVRIKQDILKIIDPFRLVFGVFILLVFVIVLMSFLQIIYYNKSKKQLFTDPLTKVFNRNYLNILKPSLNLYNYAIAMIDLDRFKVINDTYGHECGDYVLRETAKIIRKSLRDQDIFIRYGGEEFVLLILTRQESKIALDTCERLRKAVEQHNFKYDNNDILVRISIGLNPIPVESKNFDEALKIADQQLYISKKNGRNLVSVAHFATSEDVEHIRDENSMEFVSEAINNEKVLCLFQAIYSDKLQKIVKYESLVRIVDSNEKLIAPMEFLPYIEHTNLYYALSNIILDISFQAALQTDRAISINLSYYDLMNKDIEEKITTTLQGNPALAKKVTFEILETNDIENVSLFQKKISALQTLGSTIAIDDFGSGYANFRMVLDMKADYLKLDGTLIKNIDRSEQDLYVVKNMIQFAHDAGMQVIAEFVHSKAVYDKLVTLNVDFLQGYYIAAPERVLLREDQLFKS
jgi:diguanylate cyclase (GGDEF)-like protein